jgi:hypothetical protein
MLLVILSDYYLVSVALWAKTITDTSDSLILISDKHTKHIDLCHISRETRTKMSSNCWNQIFNIN